MRLTRWLKLWLNMKKTFSAFLLAAVALSSATADTLGPAGYKAGDRWMYEISTSSVVAAKINYQQEYTILWLAASGNYVTGQRRANSGNTWVPGASITPNRCLVLLMDVNDKIADDLCGKELLPGAKFVRESQFSRRVITFVGESPVQVPAGEMNALQFVIDEEFTGGKDDTAPLAKKRLWSLWYSPDARAFAKLQLRYVDVIGAELRTVSLALVNFSVK